MSARRLKMFESVVLFHPNDDPKVHGTMHPEKTQVTDTLRHFLAPNEEAAKLMVVKNIDDKYMEYADRLEILMRPF